MYRRRTATLLLLFALAGRAAAAIQSDATQGEEPDTLGSASALRIEADPGEPVLVEAGTRLRDRPHPHAKIVTVVDVDIPLAPLERRGEWVRLRFGDRTGWMRLGELESPPEIPTPPEPPPTPPGPRFENLEPDVGRLQQALDQLAAPVEPIEAGPFLLYTDVGARRKRELAVDVALHLRDAYVERYGLRPPREARFAVVVFEHERSYRRFESNVQGLSQLAAQGHAGSGVAALVAEGRTAEEVAALLVHELTHLLNRQMFLAPPPAWLEEGIANDLAYCQLDRKGRLKLASLGGKSFIAEIPGPSDRFGRRRFSGTFHMEGPIASLSMLKRARSDGELVPLPELMDLTWREFVDPEGRKLRYVQSTFFVRYLLDELGGEGLRTFLSAFQDGGSTDTDALLAALATDWASLTAGFEAWIRDHRGR